MAENLFAMVWHTFCRQFGFIRDGVAIYILLTILPVLGFLNHA